MLFRFRDEAACFTWTDKAGNHNGLKPIDLESKTTKDHKKFKTKKNLKARPQKTTKNDIYIYIKRAILLYHPHTLGSPGITLGFMI